MFNIFKRAPKKPARFRYVDWDKVKTVEDIVSILKVMPTARIRAMESAWEQEGVAQFLGSEVWVITDHGAELEK